MIPRVLSQNQLNPARDFNVEAIGRTTRDNDQRAASVMTQA